MAQKTVCGEDMQNTEGLWEGGLIRDIDSAPMEGLEAWDKGQETQCG